MAALAVSAASAAAQQPTRPPAPPSTPPAEPAPAVPASGVPLPAPPDDSLKARADSVPRDTTATPFATAERPVTPERRGTGWRWSRDEIYVTGATNLAELLAEIPGVTLVRSSYLLSPIMVSWYGEPGRVRVFHDGVEWDALDARTGGQLDLASIPLLDLEDVSVERSAGELRVHLRSWRVEYTPASTRVDVSTGAENLTLYRGYYGKRWGNGLGLQVTGEQYSVANGLTRGDGSAAAGAFRFGWASGDWTVDVLGRRMGRERAGTRRFVRTSPVDNAMARFEGGERAGVVRVAYRQPDDDGVWLQALAAAQAYVESDSAAAAGTTPDPDTLRSRTQYVMTGGLTRGAWRLSAAGRYRVGDGAGRLAPSVRAAYGGERLAVAIYGEQGGPDSTRRLDLTSRVAVFRWLHIAGSASQHTPEDAALRGPTRTTVRGEVGLHGWGRWLAAGVIQRSAAQVPGMPVYDTAYRAAEIPEGQGLFVSLGGPVVGPISLDWHAVDWGDEQLYRPKITSRAALTVTTDFRIPRRVFLLRFSAVHDYRSDMLAPDGAGGIERAKGASAFSTLLDIRLGSAHIFWHNRNFTGMPYETVPGYLMPRLIQQYGVRWEFWN